MKAIKRNYIFNRGKSVLFKSKDFEEILMILEKIYFDNKFLQDKDSEHGRQLLKLINDIYKVINNIKIYESEIYKDNFNWGDIDRIIFRSCDDLVILKDNIEVDNHILERQIEILNRLHVNDSINMNDLSSLLDKNIKKVDNDLKDFIYREEKFWNVLREGLIDLSLQEYALILFYIEGVLNLNLFMSEYTKLYQSLINIRIKILNLFREVYSSIDYFG